MKRKRRIVTTTRLVDCKDVEGDGIANGGVTVRLFQNDFWRFVRLDKYGSSVILVTEKQANEIAEIIMNWNIVRRGQLAAEKAAKQGELMPIAKPKRAKKKRTLTAPPFAITDVDVNEET